MNGEGLKGIEIELLGYVQYSYRREYRTTLVKFFSSKEKVSWTFLSIPSLGWLNKSWTYFTLGKDELYIYKNEYIRTEKGLIEQW